MSEVVPDYRDGWRLENKGWTRVIMKTDTKTGIKGTTISKFIMDEPMLKNEKNEDKTSDDREMLDMVLKENHSLQAQLGQVVTMCDRWFNGLSPSDKIEMMVRYYQLRLNCYENNKKESK